MVDCVSLPFRKGHGTENDFVIIEDDHAELDLSEALVRKLCSRRAGVGADGVLRVARAGALRDHGILDEIGEIQPDQWFMDHRNADGSTAEMCGNGLRVFAHVLAVTGRIDSEPTMIGTRAGSKMVRVLNFSDYQAMVEVDMGSPVFRGVSTADFAGLRVAGLAIDVGNPHLACVVPGLTAEALAKLPIDQPPTFDNDLFPLGVNVEVATPIVDGSMQLRVHERGVGETQSCGTGIVATAAAALADTGVFEGLVEVHVPGGIVVVEVGPTTARMTGPSALVATGIAAI